MSETAIPRPIPLWYRAAASLGLAWNIYGLKQFGASLSATSDSLSAQGMTPEQARIMLTYPAWRTAAFALGVILGTVGCLLLLVRHRLAGPVLAISLVSYLALNAGDAIHGGVRRTGRTAGHHPDPRRNGRHRAVGAGTHRQTNRAHSIQPRVKFRVISTQCSLSFPLNHRTLPCSTCFC